MAQPLTTQPLLSARALTLSRQNRLLVDEASLDLPACGTVALIGPNGAGKSSLLNLLAGQIPPSRGGVFWQGRALDELNVAERAQRIGYLPQRFDPYWDLTLTDLVDMRVQGRASVTEVLERAGLQGFAARRWSTLSGGERGRGMLAAVLATDPPALLADEPGAALDVRHRLALVDLLASRGRDRLVVAAMHDLDLAFECFDRIIVMDEGRIALDGKPCELLHDPMLDRVFGVTFERIAIPDIAIPDIASPRTSIPPQTLLRARRRSVGTTSPITTNGPAARAWRTETSRDDSDAH